MLTLLFASLFLASCSDYGSKIEATGGTVYYKDGISEESAQKVTDFLSEENFFSENGDKRSVQLQQDDNKITHMNFVVKEDYLDNPSTQALLYTLGFQTAFTVLNLDTLNINLCDNHFKTEKVMPIGIYKFGENAMVYTDAVKKSEAIDISNFMISSNNILEDAGFVFVIDKESNTYQLKLASREGAETDANIVANVTMLSLDISHHVLNDQPINFWFLDNGLNMKRVINYQDMVSNE